MDFSVFRDKLVAGGYSDDTADAKIAHDIVLKAVRDSQILQDSGGRQCGVAPCEPE